MSLHTNQEKLFYWCDRILNIEENPKPIHLVASITGRCNWNCPFCYLTDNKSVDLDYDRLINFIDSLPIKSIEITGGEPTLHKRIDDLINHCYDKGIRVGMTTNGSMITDHSKILGTCPIKDETFKKIDWIRISINRYYNDNIIPTWSLPKNIHLGFNLIYDSRMKNHLMPNDLHDFMRENKNFKYMRISLDRNCDEETRDYYIRTRNDWKDKFEDIQFRPIIYPECYTGKCYCGYIKPILEWDGLVYNCISELEMYGHKSPMVIADIDHPEKLLEYPKNRKVLCKYCYYRDRNIFVSEMLRGFHKEFL